jgi:hypothetical protein
MTRDVLLWGLRRSLVLQSCPLHQAPCQAQKWQHGQLTLKDDRVEKVRQFVLRWLYTQAFNELSDCASVRFTCEFKQSLGRHSSVLEDAHIKLQELLCERNKQASELTHACTQHRLLRTLSCSIWLASNNL